MLSSRTPELGDTHWGLSWTAAVHTISQTMTNARVHLAKTRIETCPECNEPVRQTESAESTCTECGLVLSEQHIDHGPEWRFTSDPEESQRRTGSPLTNTHANRGLSTWMGNCNRDGNGNQIESRKRRRLRRQRTQQRRAAADANRDTLEPGLKEIARQCSDHDLSDAVEETASVIYRRALDDNLLYGWSYEGITSAAVFIAARQTGAVRTLSEIVACSYRPKRRVARAIRHLQRELNLAVEPPAVTEYVPTIADDLDLSKRQQRLARALLEAAIDENIHSGRDPSALAASALYTVSLAVSDTPDLCQTEISDAVDIAPLTVRTHFRELRPLCPKVFDVDAESIDAPQSRSGKRSGRRRVERQDEAEASGQPTASSHSKTSVSAD